MKKLFLNLLFARMNFVVPFLAAALIPMLAVPGGWAANVGPAGYTNAITAVPATADFTTLSLAANSTESITAAAVDTHTTNNAAASSITTALTSVAGAPANLATAVYNSTDGVLQTKPTGNRTTLLMATLSNTSGSNATSIKIVYDYTRTAGSGAEEVTGQRVFYSFTGAANTWIPIPGLSGVASTTAGLNATVSLTWNSGAALYILWADDNGQEATEWAYQIDNFGVAITGGAATPASITLTSPVNGSSVITPPGTVTLQATAVAGGVNTMTGVGFYATNGGSVTFLASDLTAPFDTSATGLSAGTYGVYAIGTNSAAGTFFSSTNLVTVTAPLATLTFLQQPSQTLATAVISPEVQVGATNTAGAAMPGIPITLALTGGGSLGGTLTQNTDGSGVAHFANLTVSTAGTKTLIATNAGSLVGRTSISFSITNSPPILVGAGGSGSNTFDTLPPVTQWSNRSLGGASDGTHTNTVNGTNYWLLDSNMTVIASSDITTALLSQPGNGTSANAYWRSGDLKLGTQPTGNSATLLMATLTNVSGGTISTLSISYNLSSTNSFAEQLRGHRVYYSATGATGSWTVAGNGEFDPATSNGTINVTFTLTSLTWAANTSFYVVWMDDNGFGTDGGFGIDNVSFTPGANASTLSFQVQPPASSAAGATLTPEIQVLAKNAGGNPQPGVTVGLSLNSGTLNGTVSKVTDGFGVAHFNDLSVPAASAGTGKILTATNVAAAISVVSSSFTIVAPLASLKFQQQPSVAHTGSIIAPEVQVKALDAGNNSMSNITVTLSLVGAGTLGGTVTASTDTGGVAHFANLTVSAAGTGDFLIATNVAGLVGTNSTTFNITNSPALASLAFQVQPSTARVRDAISPTVEVLALDVNSNPSAGTIVTVSLAGTGTLGGARTNTTDANGVASFNDLTVSAAGSGNILVATNLASALGVSSTAFSITNPPPISVGVGGSGTETFSIQPFVSQWTTVNIPGDHNATRTDAQWDTSMSTNGISIITSPLVVTAAITTLSNAQWRSDLQRIVTQPTTPAGGSSAALLLMATLTNVSGATINTLNVAYLLSETLAGGTEARTGHRVYSSLNGTTWTALGNFGTAILTTNSVAITTTNLGWAANNLLYIVWLDEDGTPTDGDWGIDNISFTPSFDATVPTLTSSGSPTLPGANVDFTNKVTSAAGTPNTGTVQFRTNGVAFGSPVAVNGSGVAVLATTSLPHGSYTISAVYSGGGFFLGSTSGGLAHVVNTPPTAANDEGGTGLDTPLIIESVRLTANDADVDGDVLTVTATTTSTNGATTSFTSTNVTYNPVAGFMGEDRFTYTVSDGFGGTAVATVVVTVSNPPGGGNSVSVSMVGPDAHLAFAGIPGRVYTLQQSGVVTGPYTNVPPAVTATAGGAVLFVHTNAPSPSFWRTATPLNP